MASTSSSHPFPSVSDMLTDAIRTAILSGELEAGEYIRQQSVARRYGVSEPMVREALRRLEGDGLVESQPRRGVRVSRHSVDEIREIYELRILLEKLITRYAVERCSDRDIDDAEAVLNEMDRESDPIRWLILNREFHNRLVRSCGRGRLLKFAAHLRLIVEGPLRLSLGVLKRFQIAQREHRAILCAYRARDARVAAKHVAAHLQGTAELIASFLEEKGRKTKVSEATVEQDDCNPTDSKQSAKR